MRKQFSATFKAQAVQELLKEEKSVAQLAAEYGVHPTQLGKWKARALHGRPACLRNTPRSARSRRRTKPKSPRSTPRSADSPPRSPG